MPKEEKEVDVTINTSIWMSVHCAECGEDLKFKATSNDEDTVDVEVELHECKK